MNHFDNQGKTLGNSFTPIRAFSEFQARKFMFAARGKKWCTSYLSESDAGVHKWKLFLKTLEEVTLDLPDECLSIA